MEMDVLWMEAFAGSWAKKDGDHTVLKYSAFVSFCPTRLHAS